MGDDMKVAIVGSRHTNKSTQEIFDIIDKYLPRGCSEIVSGGAIGIDTEAEKYAKKYNIPFTCFRPDYDALGKTAPLARNDTIIDYADYVIVIWDGLSRGSAYVIKRCIAVQKPMKVINLR